MKNSENNKMIEMFGSVISKSWEDDDFKARLLASPESAIKELYPEFSNNSGKTLVVRDQTSEETLYVNIPASTSLDSKELTDAELEAVAGGISLPIHKIKDFFNQFTF